MTLRYSYTLFAPIYDALVAPFTASARRRSLALLSEEAHAEVLLVGIGSGLDVPLLPSGPRYTGLDLTPAMLARARRKAATLRLEMTLDVGDARCLPYADAAFDVVLLHLILAVTPHPEQVLAEAARVLRRGGRILILDKFLRPGQNAPLRRLISPLLGLLATRTNVVFEAVLAQVPGLEVVSDLPALAGGWFRQIVLRKTGF
ncbi:MAG: class I SAM-dependent methyltransferase [Candidatus Competibacteraceae bacterium]|uniref:Methyltransferase type 11 n=1 Tax=Candidatus Contendobacter odensis Run_B_J11 TaxID=1400861 RepID=A0A7U7GEV4_9GAMM|nr:class I SAM-dependent methyltransferase [Candidatus Contendobacter odensis]MBK8535070.1 class I SAM-dependent methyltransferase [Candidatus Competibacteraceae bacterium]MBK8753285.1 class I SAM-dependent methyltransferase [Candidatus Competibacteraceae bacterium]CDH46829.1 Methyltransferase type 11 [Candidatus Contendobacter odensis Run_B_J11]